MVSFVVVVACLFTTAFFAVALAASVIIFRKARRGRDSGRYGHGHKGRGHSGGGAYYDSNSSSDWGDSRHDDGGSSWGDSGGGWGGDSGGGGGDSGGGGGGGGD
ncbi:hypothetical protein AB0M02_40825 [Actinoplanes sp. NPDC051861]|uniref:hypothetical protein n=1 Tax=Actinoplanes sp. NPDC051861 TaxID=3155170 RepID=UPI00342CE0EA